MCQRSLGRPSDMSVLHLDRLQVSSGGVALLLSSAVDIVGVNIFVVVRVGVCVGWDLWNTFLGICVGPTVKGAGVFVSVGAGVCVSV